MSREPITALVTAVGGGGHGEQILKALRLADAGRYRILGADMNPNCPQFEMVERAFALPAATHPEFLQSVLNLCAANNVRALFHGCEPELTVYSAQRAYIEGRGIFLPINPVNVIDTCMDKVRCAAFLGAHGFAVPRSYVIESCADIAAIDRFPVVIKPFRGSGGSKDCFIAQTPAQLAAIAAYLEIGPDSTFVVQEYVGTPDLEYTVGVLHDMDGYLINSIALRRDLRSQLNIRASVANRTGRSELGERLVISSGVSQGSIEAVPEITSICERIAAALGARGPLNIQGRLVDDTFYVFEINPRFSGTTSLRAMVGYNEPDLLIRRHVLGENIPARFPYRQGHIVRSLKETLLVGS